MNLLPSPAIGKFHINVWIQCVDRTIGRPGNTSLAFLHGACLPEPRGGRVLRLASDHTQYEPEPALV